MNAALPELQAWFQQQLTGVGATGAWTIDELIEPSQQRTPAERLSVYQNAYVARLVDCLATEFPAVQHAVGKETFFTFATADLTLHPPQSYTLGQLGAEFAETLQSLRPPRDGAAPDFGDFLVQLATYERMVSEVFDAEGPERGGGLDAAVLSRLSADDLNDCRLELYPCVRLFEADFPVHEYVSAVRRDREPEPSPPRPVRLVLHRQEYVVRRFEVAAWQFALLQALLAGETMASALSGALAKSAKEHAEVRPDAAFIAFEQWSRGEIFRRLVRPERINESEFHSQRAIRSRTM
jgi:hypothetical protein